jgi:hypothetical protein
MLSVTKYIYNFFYIYLKVHCQYYQNKPIIKELIPIKNNVCAELKIRTKHLDQIQNGSHMKQEKKSGVES